MVSGSLRATDTIYSTTNQFQILRIPTSSNGTTYGPGTNGQVLKSNGTSVYWASDNNSDTNVTQAAAITTAGAYPLILANSTATTAVTGTVNKTSTLTYNPNTKSLVTGGTVNGYTLAAACAKGVTDNSSNADVANNDTNLITGRTLYYQLAKKGYTTNTGTVTSVQVQATSPITSSTSTAQTGSLNTTIALADNYGDTKNPYASKTKNYVLAAGATANSVPSFRALVAADIPNLAASKITSGTFDTARIPTNISITGSSASCTGNAATATKATQDANGNDISSTYLKLSGGTLTGNMTVWPTGEESAYVRVIKENRALCFLKCDATGEHGIYSPGYWDGSSYVADAKWLIRREQGGGNIIVDGSCTGNAATATKATKDANGNTISSTYLKLSGGTMTGALTIDDANTTANQYAEIAKFKRSATRNNDNVLLYLGKDFSTKNCGTILYHHAGDGSDSNYLALSAYNAPQSLRSYTDGHIELTQPLGVASGGTEATTSLGAVQNLFDTGNSVISQYPSKPGIYRVISDIFTHMNPASNYGLLIIFKGAYGMHLFLDAYSNLYFGFSGDTFGEPSTWKAATATTRS